MASPLEVERTRPLLVPANRAPAGRRFSMTPMVGSFYIEMKVSAALPVRPEAN